MARLARLCVPGYPHHIIQRGNNRQSICITQADYQHLLALVRESAARHRVGLHAWVLLPDEFQLILTPPDAQALPRMMQDLGRGHVRHFNAAHLRSGTLWEGRYRGTVLDPEHSLLAAMASLDRLPLQAGLAPGCTQCGACLRACPTGALGESVDPARCLSGLTQRRQVDAQQLALIAAAPLIWGCDACQLCCPANRALPQTALPPFAQELICRLDRSDLEGLSERAFRRRYAGRAFSWRGAWPLHRNLEAQAGRLDADPPQTR